MNTAAILPVKRFALAKQRLGGSVSEPLRRELAKAMVADVLDVLATVSALSAVIVVSNEPSVTEMAADQGALVVKDTLEAGQSAAAGLGLERARKRGARRALLVPGDCPALDAGELERLLAEAPPGPAVVIVPDRHDTGTNALLLTPSEVIAPAFGPDSRERHRLLALAAGASCRIERLPSLALDIDTGADLQVLRELLPGRGRAPRTSAVLASATFDDAARGAGLTPAS